MSSSFTLCSSSGAGACICYGLSILPRTATARLSINCPYLLGMHTASAPMESQLHNGCSALNMRESKIPCHKTASSQQACTAGAHTAEQTLPKGAAAKAAKACSGYAERWYTRGCLTTCSFEATGVDDGMSGRWIYEVDCMSLVAEYPEPCILDAHVSTSPSSVLAGLCFTHAQHKGWLSLKVIVFLQQDAARCSVCSC